jgi:hypothetical protein
MRAPFAPPRLSVPRNDDAENPSRAISARRGALRFVAHIGVSPKVKVGGCQLVEPAEFSSESGSTKKTGWIGEDSCMDNR